MSDPARCQPGPGAGLGLANDGKPDAKSGGYWQRAGHARGFTMIDLLVALAVVAIIAAIAIPSYSAYVVRGQRAAAKAVLLQTAQAMERNYTVVGAYTDSNGNFPLQVVAGTAACVALSPMDSNATTYCVSGVNTASGGFILTATPCGDGPGCPAAANNAFTDPQCDQLTIDNTGLKQAIIGGVGATPAVAAQCWQQ